IEQTIVKITGIKEAVVIAREDTPGNQRLAAYLILKEHAQTTSVQGPTDEQLEEWKSKVQKSLPLYMVPNDWIVLESFPLTANNKVDRKMLPKPLIKSAENRMNGQPPLTRGQKMVAEVWKKVLDVSHLGLKDDFFELGGHSLLAVDVMTDLERETGKRIPLN